MINKVGTTSLFHNERYERNTALYIAGDISIPMYIYMVEWRLETPQKVGFSSLSYFSRKFNPPSYFDGVEMVREELPDDDVTAFLRERGFV